MKQLIALFALFGFTVTLYAQNIIADRPDQTESSVTISVRSLQIESGFLMENYGGERSFLLPATLLRYGLSNRVELRLFNYLQSVSENNRSDFRFGISDFEAGLKIQLLRKEDINTEIAFISHLLIPSGSNQLSNEMFGTINKLAFSHQITDYLGLGYNLGYNNFGKGCGDFTYSLVLGFALSDRLGFYAEPYGEFAGFARWITNFDTGFTFLVKNNLQLDASYGFGLNETMNFVSVGFSWIIHGKRYWTQ